MKVSLTIWINGDKGYNGLAEVGKKFAEEPSGIKVTVAHRIRLKSNSSKPPPPATALTSSSGLTTVTVSGSKSGLLVPVTPNAAPRPFEQFAWDAMTVDGKTYGYLVAVEAVSLIYNKDLLPNRRKPSKRSPRSTKT